MTELLSRYAELLVISICHADHVGYDSLKPLFSICLIGMVINLVIYFKHNSSGTLFLHIFLAICVVVI